MNRKLISILLSIFSLTSILVSCMHKTSLQNNNANTPIPEDSSICFERDILPIFTSNCTQSTCHNSTSAADGYVLIDYNTITSKGVKKGDAKDSKIYKVLIEDDPKDRMPLSPNPALSATQINMIKRWIDEGALNTTNCTNTNCDSNIFNYSGAVSVTLKQYCTGCHNSSFASGGIILDNYNSVKILAQNGKLIGSIKHLSGYSAMPQGSSKLSDCKILQIERWINANSPNN